MIHEDWLSSSFELCDLFTLSKTIQTNESTQLVINRSSFPRPSYNPSSIKTTLEAYSILLDSAFQQNMNNTNQKLREDESIHRFAQMTAQIIIHSAVRRDATPSSKHRMDSHEGNECNLTDPKEKVTMKKNHIEMLAKELILKACCKALEEIGGHCVPRSDDPSKDRVTEGIFIPSGYNCDEDPSEMDTSMEYDYKFITSAPSLKDMVNLGSIEYPDAPPSTPLIPEMLKSRDSFTRKLKGGLAKEFLPSPPPPTPKDQMQPLLENQMTDTSNDKSDFMMTLMCSLSLECGKQGGQEDQKAGEVNEIPMLLDYASQLSEDILDFITTYEGNKQVCPIPEPLADEILKTSLAERVMARDKEKINVDTGSLSDVSSQQRPSMACSESEEIKVLASELINNAVVHAFANLKLSGFKHGTHPHLVGQPTKQQPWEIERYSDTHLCKDSTDSNKAKNFNGCDELEFKSIKSDAVKMTSSVQTYPNNPADGIFEDAVYDASSLGTHVNDGSQRDIPPCVIKMHDEESREVQELQCVLLWAAASQNGASELQFDLPDRSIKQKLCRLSRSAHVNGWTVGALVASLCQLCDDGQGTSRGHYRSSGSLLEHLQLLIDHTPFN